MTSLVWPLDLAPALQISKVVLNRPVGFAKNLGNRAGGNLVSNQSEHGISQHIDGRLVAVLGIELRHLLAGIAVG